MYSDAEPMRDLSLFSLIDFLSVFAGALGGALATKRDERFAFDIIGVLGLGFVSALGGGITRDLVIAHGPPLAFQDSRYLLMALVGAAAALLIRTPIATRIGGILLVADAAALGLFAVAGATRAIDAGLGPLAGLLLGVTTAVGGGAMRDVLSGSAPRVFQRGELYAIVAVVAATFFLVLVTAGLTRPVATTLAALAGFLLRLAAVRFGWRTRAARAAPQ